MTLDVRIRFWEQARSSLQLILALHEKYSPKYQILTPTHPAENSLPQRRIREDGLGKHYRLTR